MKEFDYCLRCGRKLKNPKARLIGYGVICLNKIQHLGQTPLFTTKEGRENNGKTGNEISN